VHLGVRVAPGNRTGSTVHEGRMAFHQRLDVRGLALRVDKLGVGVPSLSTLPVVGQLLERSGVVDLQCDARRNSETPGRGLHLMIVKPGDLACDARGRLLRHIGDDRSALRRLLGAVGEGLA